MKTIDELLTQVDRISCLPMHQLWATLVFYGKEIENRSRPTRKRETIVIYACVTATGIDPSLQALNDRGISLEILPDDTRIHYGALLGTVDIIDCTDNTYSDKWVGDWGMPRSWHWHLKNAQLFPEPEPFRAPSQGWFYLSHDLLKEQRSKGVKFAHEKGNN